MPKIIENARGLILDEAKKQIREQGYAATTVRSVAAKCKVAIGTVYNYFPSKEILISSFMADDWKICMDNISAFPSNDTRKFLYCIHENILTFADKHRDLFDDSDARRVFTAAFDQRHEQLIDSISLHVLPLCKEEYESDRIFTSRFIAECLLTLTMRNVDFEQMYRVIRKLL